MSHVGLDCLVGSVLCFPMGGASFLWPSVSSVGLDHPEGYTAFLLFSHLLVIPRPKPGLTVAEIEDWGERLFLGAENALRARPKDEEALEPYPFGAPDVRRVRQAASSVS